MPLDELNAIFDGGISLKESVDYIFERCGL